MDSAQLNKMFADKHRNLELGRRGEDLAANYLLKKGYKIVERNFWRPLGEIDIIAVAPDKTLVFFEVKTASGNAANKNEAILPEENLTFAKLKKLKRICRMFAGKHSELIKEEKGWRIDLLALTIEAGNCETRHYENI